MGEEPYYIDKICEEFSKKVLTDNEKVFNQTTFYGKETNIQNIIFEAKQFPFGSEKRVVIVKEAQHIKNIEDLISYFIINKIISLFIKKLNLYMKLIVIIIYLKSMNYSDG